MSLKLRDYQEEAVSATLDAWREIDRPAVVLPTGTGKTVIFAEIARRVGSSVVLVHRDELVRQTVAKLHAVAGITAGVVKAERNEVEADHIVASVQTLRHDRLGQLPQRDCTIVDECHHATAPTYRRVLDHLGGKIAGFTATMERGDGTALGDVWQKIVYQRSVLEMIRAGHLADIRGWRVEVPGLDLTGVRMNVGDFSEAGLGRAIEDSIAPEVVAQAYLEHTPSRPGILFAPTVETAHLFADAFAQVGVRVAAVWGAMPLEERRRVLRDYDRGEIDVLCNCMVLTEGYDSPRAEVCIIARPTTSAPLFVQMVGRVLRPFPGKRHATVLDVVGATSAHELVTLARLGGLRQETRPGQSVLEAWDVEDEHRQERERQYREGKGELFEVDLFGGSRQRWLRTYDGWWFLPGDKRYITIQPSPADGWDVASWSQGRGGRWVERDLSDIELAMSIGESDITDDEQLFASKTRGWRKKKATEKQLIFLGSLIGPAAAEDYRARRAGDAGDRISVHLASARVDASLKGYLG